MLPSAAHIYWHAHMHHLLPAFVDLEKMPIFATHKTFLQTNLMDAKNTLYRVLCCCCPHVCVPCLVNKKTLFLGTL